VWCQPRRRGKIDEGSTLVALAGRRWAGVPLAVTKAMSQHHLHALWHALIQKGWKIVTTRSLDDFPYDYHAWTIRRGSVAIELQFARFGDMGQDVPLEESSGCAVAKVRSISLHFSKQPRWKDDLASFVSSLDAEFP
jgi:hypothetical protein